MSRNLSVREARKTLRFGGADEKEAVLDELAAVAAAEITDVLSWDAAGNVSVTSSADIPARARKAIKKVKVTPTELGNQIEIELHDKLSANRLIAKHLGLLDRDASRKMPSVIDVNVTHVGDD